MTPRFLAEVTETQKEDTEDRKELVLRIPHPSTSETRPRMPTLTTFIHYPDIWSLASAPYQWFTEFKYLFNPHLRGKKSNLYVNAPSSIIHSS